MALSTQSTTIKTYAYYLGRLYIFSSGGVDVFTPSSLGFTRIGYAALPNATSGAVNANGVWLGTSDRGVWHCPDGRGDLTSQLQVYYATSGTGNLIQSDAINSLAGIGTKLLVCHDSGAEYFPAPGAPYQYADEATDNAAINSTYIAYSVASGLETLAFPSADWDSTDATVLTTASSPALSSNTVNDLRYGSGNNLFVAGGAGVDIYDYTDVTTIGSGSIPYVWPTSAATQAAGVMCYVDSSADAITYDISTTTTLETITGTFVAVWLDDSADLQVSDADLERHLSIDNVSPAVSGRDVRRDWSLYFEITDDIAGLTSTNITVKVNGTTVTPTYSAITDGYKVTYTPASASGYRKQVTVGISGTDDSSGAFSEEFTFNTKTSVNASAATTLPPSTVIYKDLSLTEYEDTYNSIEVNWLDEYVSAYIVDEDQAKSFAQVAVENGIYHKTIFNVRVLDTDASSNATQDIQKGDIITIDVDALGLTDKKCEVLATQRVTSFDRIEYDLVLAFYEVWA
jgi:hypothetical protein